MKLLSFFMFNINEWKRERFIKVKTLQITFYLQSFKFDDSSVFKVIQFLHITCIVSLLLRSSVWLIYYILVICCFIVWLVVWVIYYILVICCCFIIYYILVICYCFIVWLVVWLIYWDKMTTQRILYVYKIKLEFIWLVS